MGFLCVPTFVGGNQMKLLKKAAALTLSIILLMGLAPVSIVHAATTPVDIYVVSYESGTLDIRWDAVSGAESVVITYHSPGTGGIETISSDQTLNTISITDLESDYIYDIELEIYSDPGGAGSLTGRGLLYYLPMITFYSTSVDTGYDDLTGGGRQSGNEPELNLKWIEPRIYDESSGMIVNISASDFATLETMENSLNSVYGMLDGFRDFSTFEYRINLSTTESKLNGSPDEAALIVEHNGLTGRYEAHVSGSEADPVTCQVQGPDIYGFLSFNILGRADTTIDVADIVAPDANTLPDGDILPGTVYYMNIKPVVRNASGVQQSAIIAAKPVDQNGSLLSGPVAYAYTPIRFQLTKDSINNVYVKIYRINQGSLDLPRLYYEVQAGDDPSNTGDWTVMYTLNDSYFVGETTTVPIDGGNPNNLVYYKIVVKSDSEADRLESLKMPYMLSIDTSRPPVPTGAAVTGRTLHASGPVILPNPADPANTTITFKSTDVTVTWDKPEMWATSKDTLAVHFLVSTNQSNLEEELLVPLYVNGTYWDEYPVNYRLVKYVIGDSANIADNGTTLSYTIDAFSLFKGEDSLGNPINFAADAFPGNDNTEGYPTFFLPNTVYYLQMYTTLVGDAGSVDTGDMSDRSVVATFTTLTGAEQEVPLPMNFMLEANGTHLPDDATSPTGYKNYIDLIFDKVQNLDWTNYTSDYDTNTYNYDMYYDIYMNTRTDTEFTLVGTTEHTDEDVIFTGSDDPTSTSIVARISQFEGGAAGTDQALRYTRFGSSLQPNTTYYYIMKIRLVITDKLAVEEPVTMPSRNTAILSVTTVELVVNVPDDTTRKPLAPVDLAIATDSSGNQIVTGRSVTLTWERIEDDVIYELIRTSSRVATTDQLPAYSNDEEYLSFLAAYDEISDGDADNDKVYLDPENPPHLGNQQGKFTYNSETNTCTYVVDLRMFPNKLYYFSLKAVRVIDADTVSESVWVSIPVTTSLIEAPTSLLAVSDVRLGFFWTDATAGVTAEDFYIYIKKSGDSNYILVTRSASTVVADEDGSTFYGRLYGLELGAYYDIRVYRGSNKTNEVYSDSGVATRDGAHEIEVAWVGTPVDDYSSYELAIRAEGEADYTTLTSADLEMYTDKNGYVLPYYWEETKVTSTTDYQQFHARIKSMEVALTDDVTTHQTLRSNVKYYIKVRSLKVDSVDLANTSYSKYAGPVNIRTEFNQSDYDDTDRQEQTEAVFRDKIEDMEMEWYWRVATSGAPTKILIKSEPAVNMVNYASGAGITLDISEYSSTTYSDVVYVPLAVVRALNSKGKNLLIRTSGAEYTLKPGSLDTVNSEQIKTLDAMSNVEDIYLQITINRSSGPSKAIPSTQVLASTVNSMDVLAQGTSISSANLKKLIDDKLYNKDSGLVSETLSVLLNTYIGSGTDSYKILEGYTNTLVEVIEDQLSNYINTAFEAARLSTAVQSIQRFNSPMAAKLNYISSDGVKSPYVLYDDAKAWQKLSSNVGQTSGSLIFNITGTGEYVILAAKSMTTDIDGSYWASTYITRLTTRYDLSEVFTGSGSTFAPENIVACSEIVLLYEKVTGKANENYGLTIRQKSTRLGLDDIFSPTGLLKSVKRQETAAVLIKLIEVKKGLSPGSMKPGATIYISDETGILDKFYNPVLAALDLKVMSVDSDGNFKPNGTMTRAETAAAFVKLLQLTGDISE